MTLSKYRFEEIAINYTQKVSTEEDQPLYIGLEHLTLETFMNRWGAVPLKGES